MVLSDDLVREILINPDGVKKRIERRLRKRILDRKRRDHVEIFGGDIEDIVVSQIYPGETYTNNAVGQISFIHSGRGKYWHFDSFPHEYGHGRIGLFFMMIFSFSKQIPIQ